MEYDVVVIGGGPGGYVFAIKAAQLGLKVACVEKLKTLGGTCLNEGCIPSKSLLHSSHLYYEAKNKFAEHGISCTDLSIDIEKTMLSKSNVIDGLAKGIAGLLAKNKVTRYIGHGYIKQKGEVVFSDENGKELSLKCKNIVIATGSEVSHLNGVEIDGKYIVSSKHALEFTDIPQNLIVIGGGVIGLELGSVWNRLGANVTVIEYCDALLPGMDKEVSKEVKSLLEKQGMKFLLSTKFLSADVDVNEHIINVKVDHDGKEQVLQSDKVLISIGRKPYTESLGLTDLGVKKDNRGNIVVDHGFKTNVDGIYAIGDVIDKGAMLAHKAEEEGVALAEILVGQKGHIDYNLVPSVVYIHPEVACIGKTAEQLDQLGVAYKVGKFPFMANSRARANLDSEGFVKIIADKKTDEVLGVHIVGPQAGTLIGEISVAMAYRAASEDIARICHSHPDLNEAIKEAALATFFKPIHM